MDWKTASSYYETRLSEALNVQRHALNLALLPQVEIPAKLRDILKEETEPARRQLQRLKKREFRIAVVGLEKAGKSTFINAWLECELLPSKAARCTFTTTQIYSVILESEQRLEVQTKTEAQFSQLIEDLKQANAQEDLKTIKLNESTLNAVRSEGNLFIPFTRLEDIREQLKKYAADERYAHAVLEARLYTNKLAQAEGIVFYDVPGLDSGLAKHLDEARQMLSDCDAVILVQRFTTPRERELDIIKFTEEGDKNVTVADKFFVFLSRIDDQATPEALQKHLAETKQNWSKLANLPERRITSGSAGAYLVLNGLAEKQTLLEIGYPEDIQNKLKSLTGIEDAETLKTTATGIPVIKDNIFHYINTERVNILKKRCETSIAKIINTSEEIYNLTRKHYPENPEEAKRFEEEKQRILFSQWWHEKWEQIKADLSGFYESFVSQEEGIEGNNGLANINKFKARYLELVKEEIEKFRHSALEKKDIIFPAVSAPTFDRAKANFIWRDTLYTEATKALASISNQLAIELQEEALQLVDYMTGLLWGSKQVKERLIENSENFYLLKLENSLSVLFLRFARPVAEALIRGPVDSDTRNEIIKNLGIDIEILDNYYQGDEPAFKVLKRYVKYGAELLFNVQRRLEILGINGKTSKFKDRDNSDSPQNEVIFEVETDINAFEEYLRSAIFEAAGFESYYIHELKSLVDSFREKQGTWSGVALNEWLQGNPALLSELPPSLKAQEFNLEVSDRLRQLSGALKSFRVASENYN